MMVAMRLEIFGDRRLSSYRRSTALTQAELVLASRGVLLTECVEAIAADARKELPEAHHWTAFVDAERAALTAAFGSPEQAGDVVLGLVVSADDFVDEVVPKLVSAGLATIQQLPDTPRVLSGVT